MMMRVRLLVALGCLCIGSSSLHGVDGGYGLMPRVEDETQMWWADGFPSHTPTARWLRVIQTGRYAMALNTESLRVEHLGAVSGLDAPWSGLPGADLDLRLTVDGKVFQCRGGGKWSRWGGPRLIESGKFFQRGDVTDLIFAADDGVKLNVDARLETSGWADRLNFVLAARPGLKAIAPGEKSFGRVAGGFGLDGTNYLEIPANEAETAGDFTLEFWVMLPADHRAGPHLPWLVCKNGNELVDGNYGLMVADDGRLEARINLGGGRENAHAFKAEPSFALRADEWNHVALSYDGDVLRLWINGRAALEERLGKPRVPKAGPLAIGQRQDGLGKDYRCRGVVDEIRLYERAVDWNELQPRRNQPENDLPALKPLREWTFDGQGVASMKWLSERWKSAAMELRLTVGERVLQRRWDLPKDGIWADGQWRQVALAFDPVGFKACEEPSGVVVEAAEFGTGKVRPVSYEPAIGWHRINLDHVEPIGPAGETTPSNDAMERVKLSLSNATGHEQTARLMFEKTAGGMRQRLGAAITGVSAVLRDMSGDPTGIPVQLSKNWHNDSQGGVHSQQWFHGLSEVRLAAGSRVEFELTLVYGHWGGVAAASHAQLCLVGWGSNQLWDQSALGAWGESICYEPDQVQRGCTIMDVRPVMLHSQKKEAQWGWTNNVGGGDFFALFDREGNHLHHLGMRTTYVRQGPCLTEVIYAGGMGDGITHSATVSLARTDDVVRGIYRLRMDVKKAVEFSRFVVFQVGADTYNSSKERKMAMGNESGLSNEWQTQWGGGVYRMQPMECAGRIPWMSLHEGQATHDVEKGPWANRGIVIRQWKAKLGGKEAAPWISEHGLTKFGQESSTLDLVPPPGITHLEPGDYVEATIEHVVMPQFAGDYYGPNVALREALTKDENTWRMIHREAVGNDRCVEMKVGLLQRMFPAISIQAANDQAEFTLTGGLGYVPITISGLSSPTGFTFLVDDQPLQQSVHGRDFWQTDYDAKTKRWSLTYNVPVDDAEAHRVRLRK